MVNWLWFPSREGLGVGSVSKILTRRLININLVNHYSASPASSACRRTSATLAGKSNSRYRLALSVKKDRAVSSSPVCRWISPRSLRALACSLRRLKSWKVCRASRVRVRAVPGLCNAGTSRYARAISRASSARLTVCPSWVRESKPWR